LFKPTTLQSISRSPSQKNLRVVVQAHDDTG